MSDHMSNEKKVLELNIQELDGKIISTVTNENTSSVMEIDVDCIRLEFVKVQQTEDHHLGF